jgi:hypothetical protein
MRGSAHRGWGAVVARPLAVCRAYPLAARSISCARQFAAEALPKAQHFESAVLLRSSRLLPARRGRLGALAWQQAVLAGRAVQPASLLAIRAHHHHYSTSPKSEQDGTASRTDEDKLAPGEVVDKPPPAAANVEVRTRTRTHALTPVSQLSLFRLRRPRLAS